MSSQNAILEQLQSLRADYELTLDQALLDASSVSTRLSSLPDLDDLREDLAELRGIAHRLAGSGQTFGFEMISTAAREVELACDDLLSDDEPNISTDVVLLLDMVSKLNDARQEPETPVQNKKVHKTTRGTIASVQSKGKRVALVEDDEVFGQITEIRLRNLGYDPRVFSKPSELEEALDDWVPDVIVMDIVIGGDYDAGLRATEKLKKEKKIGCPIILLTSRADFLAKMEGVRFGCDDFLQKPINIIQLVEAVERATSGIEQDRFRALVLGDQVNSPALVTELERVGMNVRVEVDVKRLPHFVSSFEPDVIFAFEVAQSAHPFELAQALRMGDVSVRHVPFMSILTNPLEVQELKISRSARDEVFSLPIDFNTLVKTAQSECEKSRQLKRLVIENHQSEKRLSMVTEGASDAIVTLDARGIIIIWNKTASEMFGYSEVEALGSPLVALISDEHLQTHVDAFRAFISDDVADDARFYFETVGCYQDGREFPIECTLAKWKLDGQTSITSVIRDISIRKEAETAKDEQDKRFRNFAEATSDYFWEMDENLSFAYLSERYEDVTGINPKTVIGKTRKDLQLLNVKAEELSEHLQNLENRLPFKNFIASTMKQSGNLIFLSVSGVPFYDHNNTFMGYRGTGSDITSQVESENALLEAHTSLELRVRERTDELVQRIKEQLSAEEALKASENWLRSVLDNIVDGVVTINEDGGIRSVNPAVIRMFGFDEADIVGQNVRMLMPDGVGSIHQSYVDNYLQTGAGSIIDVGGREVFGRRKDGSEFPMELFVSVMGDGQKKNFIGTIRDITKRQQANRALRRARDEAEQANMAKTEFLANMSHELRTPLNAIIGFSEIIKAQMFGQVGEEIYIEYAENINSAGGHLLSLITDILDLSKVEAGEMSLSEDVVDLGRVVSECVVMTSDRAERAGVKIDTDTAASVPNIRGDSLRIKQIILNLIANSIKFTPANGLIHISAKLEATDGDMIITVTDTGMGIPQADQEKIFQPFAQVDDIMRRSHEGSGLGLSLSRALVEIHDGELSLTSEVGIGTVVTVRFPAERVVS